MRFFKYSIISICTVLIAIGLWQLSGSQKPSLQSVHSYKDLLPRLEQHKYTLADQDKIGLFKTNYESRKELAIGICSQKEEKFQETKQQVLDVFFTSLRTQNWIKLQDVVHEDAQTNGFDNSKWNLFTNLPDIRIFEQGSSSPTSLVTSLKKYFSAYTQINDVEYAVKKFRFQELADNNFGSATFMAQLNISGVGRDQLRRSDEHSVHLHLTQHLGHWKLSRIELIKAKSLILQREPAFAKKDIATSPSVYLRREAIRRGGYALSIFDVNKDQYPDVYVGTSEKGELLLNQQGRGFQKGNSSEYPFVDETLVKAAIFGHFTQGDSADVVMTRFSIDGPKKHFGANDIAFYQSTNNQFKKQTDKIVDRLSAQYAMPAAAGDFNEDGFLDFYVGFPGKKDFSDLTKSVEKHGLAKQGFFFNDGKGGFVDKSLVAFKDQSQLAISEELQSFYPHASLAIDYDQDRHVDVLVIDDRNNLSPIYKNNGDGTFSQNADKIGMGNRGLGMSVAAGDINNDGHVDFAFTNVRLAAADRLESCMLDEFNVAENIFGDPGFELYTNNTKNQFMDITSVSGIDNPGDATAGIEIVDYNNDGLLDIVVVNGLWSGTDPNQTLDSVFVRSIAQKYTGAKEEIRFSSYFPMAQSNFMRFLMEFEGDAYTARVQKGMHPSLGGYQRNRLYRNLGNGSFVNVAYLEGVDSIADGYIVARADMNRDGAMDLVFRNADPGVSAYTYPVVEIYENKLIAKNSVVLELEDPLGLRDAYGSFAIAETKGQKTVQHLVANSGATQSEKLIHFGLGQNQQIDSLTIYWANGGTDTLENIKAGRYSIKKGSQLKQRLVGKK